MCNVRYRNIGCYNDFHMRQRPLPDRLSPKESECLKLRDLKVILNNETLMKAWNDNMYEFVCRCAEAAKKEKYNFFGVQNCGKLPRSRTLRLWILSMILICFSRSRRPKLIPINWSGALRNPERCCELDIKYNVVPLSSVEPNRE